MRRPLLYRPLSVALIMLAVLSILFAATSVYSVIRANHASAERSRDAVTATCAIQRAIIDAGLAALQSGVLLPGDRLDGRRFVPGPLTRKLGAAYPGFPARLARAKAASSAYEARISAAVRRAAGIRSRPGVPLDCHMLLADAR